MKEIMAIIRPNRFGMIKNVLADAGYPAYHCCKVMGRGKKMIDASLFKAAIEEEEITTVPVGEYIESMSRLMPKRMLTMIVPDEKVQSLVQLIMENSSDGHPGDGKIFVLPILESLRIRDGKEQNDTESY